MVAVIKGRGGRDELFHSVVVEEIGVVEDHSQRALVKPRILWGATMAGDGQLGKDPVDFVRADSRGVPGGLLGRQLGSPPA
jgi:hypothetical protein